MYWVFLVPTCQVSRLKVTTKIGLLQQLGHDDGDEDGNDDDNYDDDDGGRLQELGRAGPRVPGEQLETAVT